MLRHSAGRLPRTLGQFVLTPNKRYQDDNHDRRSQVKAVTRIGGMFLALVLMVAIFYHPLRTLLSRGALTIKWGDREISITEIDASVDTQFNELESTLANIVDEIDELKRRRPKVEEEAAGKEDERAAGGTGILEAIRETFPEATSDHLASIIFHLGMTTYKWRNQATLSKRTGLDAETIDSLALSAPKLVIRSRAKSGNVIYRLTPEAKGRFLQATRRAPHKQKLAADGC